MFSRLISARSAGLAALAAFAMTLGGCGAIDRIDNIGAAPALAPIANPTTQPGYRPVSMPMPTAEKVDSEISEP